MSHDPLLEVIDEPLSVSEQEVQQLLVLRAAEHFPLLPGVDTAAEKTRLSAVLIELIDRIVGGVLANPSKLWVMKQFQPSLEAVQAEDTEGREHFGTHLEQIMDILHIESSNGLLSFYL